MTMSAFKKILCPTDFSEASYEGLDKAVLLASEAAAEICVVHVEPPTRSITAYAGHAPEAHQEVQRRAETVKSLWSSRVKQRQRLSAPHVKKALI
jgi:nucleotide-binding universal stress UspA family protein